MTHAIPKATLALVAEAPADRPVALLVRHSVRGPLPPGQPGNEVPLLEEGRALARELGGTLGARLRSLRTSPVPRCVQTAQELAAGAGVAVPVVDDRMLGDPGAYVLDGAAAWAAWCRLGHEGVMDALVAGEQLEGLAPPFAASRRLVEHLLAQAGAAPGFHVFVTHDSLVTVAAAHCLRRTLPRVEWPGYLEALGLVTNGDGCTARYRAWTAEVRW